MDNFPKRGWTGIRRRVPVAILLAALAVSSFPSPASAHPLGAESVDHYSEVEVTPRKIIVAFDVYLAEVVTFQALKSMDSSGKNVTDAEEQAYTDAQARVPAAHLRLEVNGRPLALTPASAQLFVFRRCDRGGHRGAGHRDAGAEILNPCAITHL
jgi:hypothetical protein